jgi:hypothetical protein
MSKQVKNYERPKPQKAVCLSAQGRQTYDKLKAVVEKQVGMGLTHDQVMSVLLQKVKA